MSSVVFDTLQASHSDQLDAVQRFDGAVTNVLREEPAGVLDELALATESHVALSDVEVFLVELCEAGVLEVIAQWRCPNGGAIAEEADSVAGLPERIECDCGSVHYFDPNDIEIVFAASPAFEARLRSESGKQ